MTTSLEVKLQRELNSGLLSLMLLATLEASERDLYPYQIAQTLNELAGGNLCFKSGSIYPVLRSLAAAGLLSSRIVPSYSGPPRHYYQITEHGREILQRWTATWRSTRDFADRLVDAAAR